MYFIWYKNYVFILKVNMIYTQLKLITENKF